MTIDVVVHRLKWDLSDRRVAVCGAEENKRRGERLNFTIEEQYVENCPACIVVDTGTVCPSRRRWWWLFLTIEWWAEDKPRWWFRETPESAAHNERRRAQWTAKL